MIKNNIDLLDAYRLSYKAEKNISKAGKGKLTFAICAAAIILFLGVGFIYYNNEMSTMETKLALANEYLMDPENIQAEIDSNSLFALIRSQNAYNKAIQQVGEYLTSLYRLESPLIDSMRSVATLNNVLITEIRYNNEDVRMACVAGNSFDAAAFAKALEADGLLFSVRYQGYIKNDSERIGKDIYSFEVGGAVREEGAK